MPLIWRMSYHATNSSHVTDHFLSTLLSLHYMCYVACCWKSHLTPAVLYWKVSVASVSLSRQDAAAPRRPRIRAHMLARFMVRLYTAVVCSYGEALADRIVSYHIVSWYFVWYRIVSIVFSYGCIVPSLLLSVKYEADLATCPMLLAVNQLRVKPWSSLLEVWYSAVPDSSCPKRTCN